LQQVVNGPVPIRHARRMILAGLEGKPDVGTLGAALAEVWTAKQKETTESLRRLRSKQTRLISRYKAALERLGQPGARLVLAQPLAGPQHHPCENLLAGGSISAAVAAATRPIDRGGVVRIDPDRTGIKPWLGKLKTRTARPCRIGATLALVAVHGSMVANVQDGAEPRACYEGASSDDTDARWRLWPCYPIGEAVKRRIKAEDDRGRSANR
jgi:hypothetical protein